MSYDRPHPVAEAAGISDADDFVAENRNTAEEVLQRFLRGKSDGNTADAQSGERSAQVEAERAHYGENGQDDDRDFEHPLAQNHERFRAHAPGEDGSLPHAPAALPAKSATAANWSR